MRSGLHLSISQPSSASCPTPRPRRSPWRKTSAEGPCCRSKRPRRPHSPAPPQGRSFGRRRAARPDPSLGGLPRPNPQQPLPAWKELLAEPDSPFRSWTAAHIEEVAKLAQEVQDEILRSFNFEHGRRASRSRSCAADLEISPEARPRSLPARRRNPPSVGRCLHQLPLTTLASAFPLRRTRGTCPGRHQGGPVPQPRLLDREVPPLGRARRGAASRRAPRAPDRRSPRSDPPRRSRRAGAVAATAAGPCVRKGQEERRRRAARDGGRGFQTGKLVWVRPTSRCAPPPARTGDSTAAASTPEAASAPTRDLLAERRTST